MEIPSLNSSWCLEVPSTSLFHLKVFIWVLDYKDFYNIWFSCCYRTYFLLLCWHRLRYRTFDKANCQYHLWTIHNSYNYWASHNTWTGRAWLVLSPRTLSRVICWVYPREILQFSCLRCSLFSYCLALAWSVCRRWD